MISNEETAAKIEHRKQAEKVKGFLHHFGVLYKARFGTNYQCFFSKDTKLVKKLLEDSPIEELNNMAWLFFHCHSDFIHKAGHSIGVFYSQIHKLKEQWHYSTNGLSQNYIKELMTTGELGNMVRL
jgi:hypothetical protein